MIHIAGIDIEPKKLFTQQEILDFLKRESADYSSLAEIREEYHNEFGNEFAWTYPYSDGLHNGFVIVAVQEGFLSLPYDYVDAGCYEVFEIEKATLIDAESMECFINDFRAISDDLLKAMGDMLDILKKN